MLVNGRIMQFIHKEMRMREGKILHTVGYVCFVHMGPVFGVSGAEDITPLNLWAESILQRKISDATPN